MKTDGIAAPLLRHFQSQAKNYESRIGRWPWNRVRSLEAAAVTTLLPDLRGLNVIDACSGSGFYARLMIEHGAAQCIAIDAVNEMLEHAKSPRISPWHGDFAKFSTDTPVDFIMCAGGIEFVPQTEYFFKAAAAATGDSGKLMILYPPQTWAGRLYRLYHRRNGLRIHLFQASEVDAMAALYGWRNIKSQGVHSYAEISLYEK